MKHKMKQVLRFMLTLAMVLGLLPGISMTAYAGSSYTNFIPTSKDDANTLANKVVKFNNIEWYIIADNSTAVNDGTVTLLSKDPIGAYQFNSSNKNNAYKDSTIKAYLDRLTAEGGSFAGVADAIAATDLTDVSVTGAKLYLLNTIEAFDLPENIRKCSPASGAYRNNWWLRKLRSDSPIAAGVVSCGDGTVGYTTPDVLYYTYCVRPALNLKLSAVTFSSGSKTFSLKPVGYSVTLTGGANAKRSGGATSQTGVTGAMTTVTYTANNGCKFPETSSYYKTTNGITVARTSDTVVMVSGTPTGSVYVTVPNAYKIPATAPTINAQPQDITLIYGYTEGSLSVKATAASDTTYNNLTYQWYSCDSEGNNGSAIDTTKESTAATANYLIPIGRRAETKNYYYCVVTASRSDNGQAATVKSNMATVTVTPASINTVAVTDIDAPVASKTLDTTALTETHNVTLGNSGAVTWTPTDTIAAYAKKYTATVIANPAENYAFANDVNATVNGQTATTVKKNNDGTLSISYTFPETALIPVTIATENKEVSYSADGIAIPVDGMFTILGGAGNATYTVVSDTGEGSFAEGKLMIKKCGTFTVKVNTSAMDTHAAAQASAKLTINKAINPLKYDAQTVIKTYSISSQTQMLAAASNGEGPITYDITSQKNSSNNDVSYFTLDGSTLILDSRTPVDTYSVVVCATAAGNDFYNSGTKNSIITVTVGKADNPASILDTATVMRGENTIDLSNNVMLNGATGKVSYEISGETNGCSLNGSLLTSGDDPGSVTVNVTVTEDDNYKALVAIPITVVISDKNTQTISANDVSVTYGDTDKRVSATVTEPATGGGTISYTVKNGSEEYIFVDAASGVLTVKKVPANGKVYVMVTASETLSCAQAVKEVAVMVYKANAVAGIVIANNRVYDGTEKPLVTAKGESIGGTMQYVLGTDDTTVPTLGYSTSIPMATDAGTYYVWCKVFGDENHNDSTATCITVKIQSETGNMVYTGEPQELVTGGSAIGGTMQYALGEDATTIPEDSAYSTSIPIATDAGIYYVWYKVVGDPNHNDTAPGMVTVTINKKTSTVTAKAQTIDEGESIAQGTDFAILDNAVDGHILSAVILTENIAEKTITPSDATIKDASNIDVTDNYSITYVGGALTVHAKIDEEIAERFTKAVNAVPGAKAGTEKGLLDKATEIRKEMTDAQLALVKKETLDLYDEEIAAFTRNRIFKSGTAYYKVLSNGDVTYLKPDSRTIKNATVPNQVKKGKFLFKVIKISNNAFRNCKQLEWVLINKNVYVFGEYIFARTDSLTKVTIKGSQFKSGKVTNAFFRAGKGGKMIVKVPGNKVNAYDRLFRSEGKLSDKSVVKAA